uniref:Potassium channel domain-containing protein n=1 Tax=Plectus sambesii TaxID=2011161 RepID=A0A914W8C8_9BILA
MTVGLLLHLNVGGTSYTLKEATIVRRGGPNSRLLQLVEATDICDKNKLCDGYSLEKNEYFFERPAHVFNIIYDYYLTGFLDFPPGISRKRVEHELNYWRLGPAKMAFIASKRQTPVDMARSSFRTRSCRARTHRFLSKPCLNTFSVYYHSIIFFFILLSIITLAYRTIYPEFIHNFPKTADNRSWLELNQSNDLAKPEPVFLLPMDRIDAVLMAIFIAELIARFIVHPSKRYFFIDGGVIVDLLTILTFIVWILRPIASWYIAVSAKQLVVFYELLLVSMSVRALKLARYSADIRLFARAIWQTAASVAALPLFVVACGTVCSMVIVMLERGNLHSGITDFSSGFLMSSTAVGFGDFRGLTTAGKIFAGITVTIGILYFACIASVIVGRFLKLKKWEI